MNKLHIASNLSLPYDALTQTFAILAKRGSGKTYTALVMVEEMLKAGLRVVVVDPVGVCWGLRAAANGRDPGLPILVLGGEHGDVPLEVAAGETIADFIIDQRQPAVIDLSLFRKGEQVRFVTDFAERLYHRNREPLHLVLDEADAFAPQRPQHGQERMLGAIEDLVRRGRARGIGVTLVTQRAAVLNKDVLTQVEVMVALRTIAPQDRAAVDEWIKVHGTPEQREQLMGSLPSLPIGVAWFWSPGWLNVFRQVSVRKRETFDSSATPKAGAKIVAPKRLAEVDLTKLRERITATIERAKANDPAELRSRIAQLQKQLSSRPTEVQTVERVVEREVPVVGDEQLASLRDIVRNLNEVAATASSIAGDIADALQKAKGTQKTLASVAPRAALPAPAPEARPVPTQGPGDPSALSNPQQRILAAIKSFEAAGISQVRRETVAVWAGASPTSGSYMGNLSTLRTLGMVDYPVVGELSLTAAGRQRAGTQSAPTLAEFQDRWKTAVTGPQGRILAALMEAYPQSVAREALAQNVGASVTSGSYAGNLSKLRTLGAIEYQPNGLVIATALLFPALESGSQEEEHGQPHQVPAVRGRS